MSTDVKYLLEDTKDAIALNIEKKARVNQAWNDLWYALNNHPILVDVLKYPWHNNVLTPHLKDRGKMGPKEIARIVEFIGLPDVYEFYQGKVFLNLSKGWRQY